MIRRISMVVTILVLPIFGSVPNAQEKPQLTVEKIMRDPKWMGTSPGSPFWSEDGQWIYFMWNPENAPDDSLYKVSRSGGTPQKVSLAERKTMPSRFGRYNNDKSMKVYEKNGDIFLLDIFEGNIRQISNTVERETNPRFLADDSRITFVRDQNLFLWDATTGETSQVTDFRKGKEKPEEEKPATDHEAWLAKQQEELFEVLAERESRSRLAKKQRELLEPERPKEIYIEEKDVESLQLSPDGLFVTFRLAHEPGNSKRTAVPNYVTDSGFTEEIRSRTKVGSPQTSYEFGIYDIRGDTVYYISPESIPGIYDTPEFRQEYAKKEVKEEEEKAGESKKNKPRGVIIQGPFWSEKGRHSVVVIRAHDNKDRWIMSLDITSGDLKVLDRQHDDAWIAGPGIGWSFSAGDVGWMPDNRRFWFQSEESGFSHLYTIDVITGEKNQVTSGRYEIFEPMISKDKKNWYFTSSEVHPGERHFYKKPIAGGQTTRLTTMVGYNDAIISPDEKRILIRYSSGNQPWDLYLIDNKPRSSIGRITNSSSQEFRAYPWREPELVNFKARDGVDVPARLYRPQNPNGAAVVFVHGAGYLQNAHKWWSSYFREYMFHNLLADRGYTVLDIDYRGSAGYGRDWRTAIYQFMGGKDLTDQVDGARFLVREYDVDPRRIGIYGGSYGGFITLMALFTEPDAFAAGAALRPVTDWAHYNHPYTSNILNTPVGDSLAYVRSSPIYHAEGLKSPLLICVGMIDTNVHFQDVVRLAQRLIELGKDNWEVAVFPLEGHGFREPSSWTDEYKRILKLFEENLN